MDQDELIAELERAGHDKELRARAVRRLAEPGAAAVPGLLAALTTVDRYVMFGLQEALRLIGPAAFDATVAARARAEKVPDWWELGHVLRGFDERCLPQYVAALSHPMGEIRTQALGGLEKLGEAAAPAVADVLPFLDDPDSYTRYVAEKAVRAMGPRVCPELRAVRRNGPAKLRGHALTALATVAGEDGLDARDRLALERLVRIKLADDIPSSLPDHRWLAVRGAAYEGLFDVMGLHDRRPCTIAMGLSAMGHDIARVPGPDGTERVAYRVFVTPELDGWRLVYADTPLWEMHWDVDDLLRRLSAACGEAQFFFQDTHSDSMVWSVAVDGAVRRSYWRYGDPEWEGEPLDWEEPLSAGPAFDPEDDHDPNATLATDAGYAAIALSLDPTGVCEGMPMSGHGWLAVTEKGVGHGPFTGALHI
ncbi:hypothetical protein [Streptomyces sp. RFCAC02]|uniref:HEAT repeat domain-containing protein n=1 Tax=Streptomyces sp. RFCAC02 TaxID=2499143 RepID=UPI001020E159|nr:hypothetical protein [Streptomyces sp. RFCAC02]